MNIVFLVWGFLHGVLGEGSETAMGPILTDHEQQRWAPQRFSKRRQ